MAKDETSALPTRRLLGTELLISDYHGLISECRKLADCPGVTAIEFANTQIVAMRRTDPGFNRVTSAYNYFVPDGMPLVWCLNSLGAGMRDRVYGPTFMRECLKSPESPRRHFLLGGSPELGIRLRQVINDWNPALEIVGSFHGFVRVDGTLKDGDDEALVAEINRLSPDYIWVGLGTPKQQAWIHRNKSRIRRGVVFGVGFGFDVNAGMKPDAPGWMQRLGLTWVFRLASEPRRLAGRYLKYNTLFLYFLLRDALAGGPRAQNRHTRENR